MGGAGYPREKKRLSVPEYCKCSCVSHTLLRKRDKLDLSAEPCLAVPLSHLSVNKMTSDLLNPIKFWK